MQRSKRQKVADSPQKSGFQSRKTACRPVVFSGAGLSPAICMASSGAQSWIHCCRLLCRS